ncbi:MAG: thioredoxin family protein [Sulfurimonas sp.]|uniref:thioredoxin family protein n=1 Tax=Sulfurimonas sp. TaxID=2022749 RepID=UPI0026398521|nr:thioredoxin family protein [Sulfurimonas sp.]MCW8894868.1 thioredoxin family protein [Sulfurimonas sp.]MCW8953722.1 thioredoxin family protein [Sulfurimonas sp.]MCW9067185.1 thioredoxin family protein [Sulfurimonas sp.]
MKIFILLFIFLASLWSAQIDDFASTVDYKRDYNTALKIAKQENKMLMLVVVADYCPWSKKFENKTLKNDSVSTLINENFIPVIIDKHRDEGSYPKMYKSPLIPAIFFIDPSSEQSVHKSLSYTKKRELIYTIDEAIKLFKVKQND